MSFLKAFHSAEHALTESSPLIQAISNAPKIENTIKNDVNSSVSQVNKFASNASDKIENTAASVQDTLNNVKNDAIKNVNKYKGDVELLGGGLLAGGSLYAIGSALVGAYVFYKFINK